MKYYLAGLSNMLYTGSVGCFWKIHNTPEFDRWFGQQNEKNKQQIRKRLRNIELTGYFGNHKEIDSHLGVWELKWDSGRRIYYAYVSDKNILLLLGGNKNGQTKDITEAKKIYKKYQ